MFSAVDTIYFTFTAERFVVRNVYEKIDRPHFRTTWRGLGQLICRCQLPGCFGKQRSEEKQSRKDRRLLQVFSCFCAVTASSLKLHAGDNQMTMQILTLFLLCSVAGGRGEGSAPALWRLLGVQSKEAAVGTHLLPVKAQSERCIVVILAGLTRGELMSLAYLRFTAVSDGKGKRCLWLSSAGRVLTEIAQVNPQHWVWTLSWKERASFNIRCICLIAPLLSQNAQ